MTDGTLLWAPVVDGCAWVDVDPYRPPSCQHPARYVLTDSAFPRATARACKEHTAAMRAMHPTWIDSIKTLAL